MYRNIKGVGSCFQFFCYTCFFHHQPLRHSAPCLYHLLHQGLSFLGLNLTTEVKWGDHHFPKHLVKLMYSIYYHQCSIWFSATYSKFYTQMNITQKLAWMSSVSQAHHVIIMLWTEWTLYPSNPSENSCITTHQSVRQAHVYTPKV